MRKLAAALACLAVLAAAYYAYPFWIASKLAHAVAVRDRDALEAYVDFPRVREGLKADLNAQLLAGALADNTHPGAALGGAIATLLGPKVVETMVDALVTPAGLVTALAGQAAVTGHDANDIEKKIRENVRSAGFIAVDRFAIALGDAGEPEDHWARVVLSLSGLTWRVTSLRLPDSAFPQLQAPPGAR